MTKESVELAEKSYCLNEVFCAEKDVASASRFRVRSDGNELGVFKSSGLLLATGTGSTGWLSSARQITPQKLGAIKRMFDTDYNELALEEIA